MYKIWFVDDLAKNRKTWMRSFPKALRAQHEFLTFATVDDILAVLDRGEWPDMIFIDYYIGPRRGSDVVEYFKDYAERPTLVAHSSMPDANQAMLSLGADIAYPKPGGWKTPMIAENIHSTEDLETLILSRRMRD